MLTKSDLEPKINIVPVRDKHKATVSFSDGLIHRRTFESKQEADDWAWIKVLKHERRLH